MMKGAKKQEKVNDERRLYERIIDMERRRSEAALEEMALLRARVKGFQAKIAHCRQVLVDRETELQAWPGTTSSASFSAQLESHCRAMYL